MQDLLSSMRLLAEPDPVVTKVTEGQGWMNEYYELPDEHANPHHFNAPWVLRTVFDSSCQKSGASSCRVKSERVCRRFLVKLERVWLVATRERAELAA